MNISACIPKLTCLAMSIHLCFSDTTMLFHTECWSFHCLVNTLCDQNSSQDFSPLMVDGVLACVMVPLKKERALSCFRVACVSVLL